MHSEKKPGSPNTESSEPGAEARRAAAEYYVPLSVRTARQIRKAPWPDVWLSFASIITLGVALAILSYRMGGSELPLSGSGQ